MSLSRTKARQLLEKNAVLFLTQGAEPCYQIDGHGVVPRRYAEEVTGNLFTSLQVQRKGELPLIPQEDGLFPGFSQTWRAKR